MRCKGFVNGCVALPEFMNNLFPRLLGDVGGTHARFALQFKPQGEFNHIRVLFCAEFSSIEEAIRSYLAQVNCPHVETAVIGIANPILGDQVKMTNHDWTFSISSLQQSLGLQKFRLINDFTALVLAVPHLEKSSLHQVGGTTPRVGAPVGLLGPGTGLGVSGLIFAGKQRVGIPLAGEGGHITLAAQNSLQFSIIENLAQRYGHVSAERALCGQGLVDIYHALLRVRGERGVEVNHPSQVVEAALEKRDHLSLEALNLFCAFLGSVAGDIALTLGAQGGIYIGGGIVSRLGTWFDTSPFRASFEEKGRMKMFNQPIPVFVIESNHTHALLGASRAFDGENPNVE